MKVTGLQTVVLYVPTLQIGALQIGTLQIGTNLSISVSLLRIDTTERLRRKITPARAASSDIIIIFSFLRIPINFQCKVPGSLSFTGYLPEVKGGKQC